MAPCVCCRMSEIQLNSGESTFVRLRFGLYGLREGATTFVRHPQV